MGRGLGWVTHRGPCQPRPCCDSVMGIMKLNNCLSATISAQLQSPLGWNQGLLQVSGDLCCCWQHKLCHLPAWAGPTVIQPLSACLPVLCKLPGDAGALLGEQAAITSDNFYSELGNLFRTHLLRSQVWSRRWSGGLCPPHSRVASHPGKEEISYNQPLLTSHPGSCPWHGDTPLIGAGTLTAVKHAASTEGH